MRMQGVLPASQSKPAKKFCWTGKIVDLVELPLKNNGRLRKSHLRKILFLLICYHRCSQQSSPQQQALDKGGMILSLVCLELATFWRRDSVVTERLRR